MGNTDNQFLFSIWQINENWRTPATTKPVCIRFPDLFPAVFVECDHRFGFCEGGNDHKVLVQNHARTLPPAHLCRSGSDTRLPELFAIQIEGQDACFAEKDINASSVGSRSTGCVAVTLNLSLISIFVQCPFYGRLPYDFSIGSIQTEEHSFKLV